MLSDIIGVILIILGIGVIFIPKMKPQQKAAGTDWSKPVSAIINKLSTRLLVGFLLIIIGVLVIEPSFVPWVE